MENIDVQECNINDNYVIRYIDKKIINGEEKEVEEYHTVTGEQLLMTFEGDLNAIAYTNAVDKHIDLSIKFDSYRKGYNEFYKDFINGNYDKKEDLEKVYNRGLEIFKRMNIEFVLIDGRFYVLSGADDIVKKLCVIYNNSRDNIDTTKYKYLDGFVNYIGNEIELKRN